MAMTILLFYGCWHTFYAGTRADILAAAVYGVLAIFFMRTYDAYQIGLSRIRLLVYSQTLADAAAAGCVYVLMVLDKMALFLPLPLMMLLLVQLLWNGAWSSLANTIYFRFYPPKRTLVIYGAQSEMRYIQEIRQHSRAFCVERVISSSDIADNADNADAPALLSGFEAVFVTGAEGSLRGEIERYCVDHSMECYVMPSAGDVLMMGASHMEIFSVPVFRVKRAEPGIEYALLKRGFDIVCSLAGIVVLSPFMLLTALAVKAYDGGPALYRQVRLTQNRREFYIYKFRSMRVDAERDGVARLAAEHDDRITPIGHVIRACRLDELPQLFNILRGDMSIVGPRPERPEIARQYEEQLPAFALRLQVRAGLTGLAQVYGRYNTDPYDKLRMDLMYINKMSLLEDIRLIFATVKILFMKESTQGVGSEQTTAAAEPEHTGYGVKQAVK